MDEYKLKGMHYHLSLPHDTVDWTVNEKFALLGPAMALQMFTDRIPTLCTTASFPPSPTGRKHGKISSVLKRHPVPFPIRLCSLLFGSHVVPQIK
ncbi:unnamed protein product [Leuciscus chuanchicus]